MSTSFEVFPILEKIPTFGEFNELLNKRICEFFQRYNIKIEKKYDIILLDKDGRSNKVNPSMPLTMSPGSHCLVYSSSFDGILLYYKMVDRLTHEIWQDEIDDKIKANNIRELIEISLRNGYYWRIKRYDNQTPITDLLFGYVTGSIAELVDGIIHTDDGAWEPIHFPLFSKDFFKLFLNPELTDDLDFRIWSVETIKNLGGKL
jgi:hypothetical protein